MAGGHFAKASGRLTFDAGQTEATVVGGAQERRQAEAGETFALKVAGAGVVAGHGIASILDDDARAERVDRAAKPIERTATISPSGSRSR